MNDRLATLSDLRVNPDWAKLPLFDRSKWQRVRFGEVVRVCKEYVDPTLGEVDRYVAGEHMDSESIRIRRWGTVGDGYLGPAFHRRFRKGQVLYGSRRTYLKKVAIAEWDGVTANTTLVLETVSERMLQELLPWLMLSERFTKHSVAESKGSTNPYINWPDVAKFEFDLPPLEQQRRIAAILIAIDDEIVMLDGQLSALRGSARAIWASHLRREGVKTVRVGQIAEVSNGSTPSRAEDRYWTGGTIPWLPTGKVHDRVIRDADEFITDVAIKEKRARIFPRGSVLVAMIGQGKTRGTAALMDIDASINQNFACITPHGVESKYLFLALESAYERLRRSSHGSNQEALNCGLVADFPIPLAPPKLRRITVAKIVEIENAEAEVRILAESARKMAFELANLI